jgi:site-specific DNA-cytosine methylase
MKVKNILSVFDGLGGARIALDELDIECNYYASEIDTHAIKVHKENYLILCVSNFTNFMDF